MPLVPQVPKLILVLVMLLARVISTVRSASFGLSMDTLLILHRHYCIYLRALRREHLYHLTRNARPNSFFSITYSRSMRPSASSAR